MKQILKVETKSYKNRIEFDSQISKSPSVISLFLLTFGVTSTFSPRLPTPFPNLAEPVRVGVGVHLDPDDTLGDI
jgi:hypothetical protein